MLGFQPYFDILHDLDSRVVSSTLQSHFTSKEVPLYSFLLEADITPGLEKSETRKNSLENFRES
jgi:hypothetical protein